MSAVETTLRQARSYARSGRTDAAADLYLDLLARYPHNRRARQGLAEVTRVDSPEDAARINEALARLRTLAAEGRMTR